MNIILKQGDIFENSLGNYQLCVFYGHNGMQFHTGYKWAQTHYELLTEINNPLSIDQIGHAIEYAPKFFLVCEPESMGEQDFINNMNKWLAFAKSKNVNSIATNAPFNPSRQHLAGYEYVENDLHRAQFILNYFNTIASMPSNSIQEVLLCSTDNTFIRLTN